MENGIIECTSWPFETSLSSMNPETLSDNMVQVIAVTVTQNLSDSGNVYRIYNSSKDLLYERNSCKIDGTEPLSVLSQEQPCSYLVKRAGIPHGFSMPAGLLWEERLTCGSRQIFQIFIRSGKATMTGIRQL